MKKLLLILILQIFALSKIQCQSFAVDELIKLSHLPLKNIDEFITKKGFSLSSTSSDSGTTRASFIQRHKSGRRNIPTGRSIDIYIKNDSKCITLHTSELNEYIEGQQRLIKSGFFYDTLKDVKKDPSILFQKANITIKAKTEVVDSIAQYSFDLTEKSIPTSLMFAEDLLQFDSHQFLVSYFGEQNVKKDMYYLSETELKKCSVLFNGTPRQVVFVWGDEYYLNNLQYILVSNVLPTKGGKENNPLSQNNEWQLKNGIYAGMPLKELLKINQMDFDIYGNKSELSFLAKPNEQGKIDFKKTAVMFSCHECYDNKIFNQKLVSALDVAKANLPLRVFDVVLYASARN
jgi:hypothetical protein